MATPLNQYSAAWALDLYESHATVYAASTDLYQAAAITALGQPYPKLIKNADQIRFTESYSDDWYGIAAPVRVTVVLDNAALDLSTSYEWRNVRCRIRRYDWLNNETRTEFTGVVIDATFAGTEVTLTVSDQPTDVLGTLIPRKLVTVDDFLLADIVGADGAGDGTTWAEGTAYAEGDRVWPTVSNDFYYLCTVAGTSHASTQPTWPTTAGDTVADNTVTWTAYDAWSYGPTDLGAAIPVVFGTADVNCPLVGEDADTSPGGQDFVVCALHDRTYAAMAVSVGSVYTDENTASPGLENALDWDTARGTPTRASDTTFTVTGVGLDAYYTPRAPLRCYIGGATTYTYAEVSSWATTATGGTVTVTRAVLTAAITGMEIGQTILIERARYGYTIAGSPPSTVNYVSLRFPDGAPAGVVARVTNSSITNPARVIQEILSYSTAGWGLGQTCDTTTFDAAATALTTAGITVGGSIGGDRRQRTAREVLRELLALRGMRLKYDGQNSEWTLAVDAAAASSLTLGLGVGTPNNVKAVRSHTKTPMDQAVSTLFFRYGTLGRLKQQEGYTIASLIPTDYAWVVAKGVTAVGKELTVTSPWIQNFEPAIRTVYYLGERLLHGDEQCEVVCGMEARDVAVGATVSLLVPHDGIGTDANLDGVIDTATNFTVVKVERSLNETVLGLRGYDSTIFETTLATIKAACTYGTETEAETDNGSETDAPRGSGANLLVNGDFSIGLRHTLAEDSALPSTEAGSLVPGWICASEDGANHYPGDAVSSMATAADVLTVGGAKLTLTSLAATFNLALTAADSLGMDLAEGTVAVNPGDTVIASIYADVNIPSWYFRFVWVGTPTTTETPTPPVRVNPRDVNAAGWVRYWSIARAPTGAVKVYLAVVIASATNQFATWEFDAAMLEKAAPGQLRPSPWKRHSPWGVTPPAVQPGDILIRPDADTDTAQREVSAGLTVGHTWGTASAGGSTTIPLVAIGATPATVLVQNAIPHGVRVDGVTVRVITTDTSGATMQIGYDNDLDAWGTGIPTTAGTSTSIADFTVLAPINFLGDGPHDVVITLSDLPTGDGELKVLVHWTKLTAPPTS